MPTRRGERRHLGDHRGPLRRDHVDGEPPGAVDAGGGTEAAGPFRVVEEAAHGAGQGGEIPDGHQFAGRSVDDDVGDAVDRRAHRGEPEQAGLDQRGGHAVAAPAGQHDHVGGRVHRAGIGERAGEDDAPGRGAFGQRTEPIALRPVARDHEHRVVDVGQRRAPRGRRPSPRPMPRRRPPPATAGSMPRLDTCRRPDRPRPIGANRSGGTPFGITRSFSGATPKCWVSVDADPDQSATTRDARRMSPTRTRTRREGVDAQKRESLIWR